MAFLTLLVSFACVSVPMDATTLQQMSLAEMAQKSSLIVRARITGSRGITRGTNVSTAVYTAYRFETLEILKPGKIAAQVAVPGGIAGNFRQVVTGAPVLRVDGEYVLFLWTGHTGLTQLMGMTQGIFTVDRTGSDVLATRAAAGEQMMDAAGRTVQGEAQSMPLAELQSRISKVLQKDLRALAGAPRVKGPPR